jgi:polysaccharide biosynthesis transport protein
MSNTQSDIDLGQIVRMLRRRARLIVSIVVVLMTGALVIVMQLPRWYAAEAVVQLDSRNTNISDLQSVTSKLIRGLQSDTTVIRTETDLMKVPAMAERVITDMNLLDDPDLNAPTMSWFRRWQQLILDNAWIDRIFPESASRAESKTPDDSAEYRLARAVRQLEKRLTVSNEGGSYLLTIRFEGKDPKRAAQVANKFAELYLKDQQEVKLETTRSANEWLGGRLVDLRNKVVESERLVASFQERHHLAETKGVTLTAQQLSEVSSQLVGVSAEVVQAQANLEAAQRTMRAASGAAGVAQVLASPLIQTLRKSEADVQRREAELSSTYLPDHPLLSEVEAERRNLQAKIDQEIGKVVAALKSDLNVAQTREAKLRARFNELQQQQAELTTADVELRELEREANANRTLYASFLEKFKETSAQEDSQQPDARLVSKAEVPLEPSFPNRPLLLFAALLASSGAAVIIALAIAWLRPGISNPEVLEEFAGVRSLGLLPEVRWRTSPTSLMLQQPWSRYPETVQSVATGLQCMRQATPFRVVMVTSSVPKEGKSVFAVSLAQSLAASGKRALLIDCDLRRPTVAKMVPGATAKLLSAHIQNPYGLFDMVARDPATDLHYIAVAREEANFQALLSSRHLDDFIDRAKRFYDTIILDTPPILAVSDALILSRLTDTSLLVVRWERTPRPVALYALKMLRQNGVALAGVLMTRVNMRKHARYNFGDASYFDAKYSGYYLR